MERGLRAAPSPGGGRVTGQLNSAHLGMTEIGTFRESDARDLAPRLLGWTLISRIGGEEVAGRIVETEAYLDASDPASHAATRGGMTSRNRRMFGPGGTAYVYFVYGRHWCFNVVAGPEGSPGAVLVRALEPLGGTEVMLRRRGGREPLASGPARLCEALGIDGAFDGHDLSRPPLRLECGGVAAGEVAVSGRIGVSRAERLPLRFYIRGNPHVSTGPHEPAASGVA